MGGVHRCCLHFCPSRPNAHHWVLINRGTRGCVLQGDAKGKGRKEGRRGRESGNREAHAGTRADPATHADTEHSRGGKAAGSQTNRNREKQQPHTGQSRTIKAPKATCTDTKWKPVPAAQDRETSRTNKGRRAQARHGGAGQSPASELPSPDSKGAHSPPVQREEGNRPLQRSTPGRRDTESHRQGATAGREA
jgi:hypothetical protein